VRAVAFVVALIGTVGSMLAFTACGSDVSISRSGEHGDPDEVGSSLAKPKPVVRIPTRPPPKKLVINDRRIGTGKVAKVGDELSVEYVAYNYRTGKEFHRETGHWGHDEPAVFELGAGEAVFGWDPGLQGMKVGGLRELTIPPRLAYGFGISPAGVRPSDTVVFVIELLEAD
jgi:peptidylprolyl isomerase